MSTTSSSNEGGGGLGTDGGGDIPTSLYVGEKSRPGRPLILNSITRLVFSIGDNHRL